MKLNIIKNFFFVLVLLIISSLVVSTRLDPDMWWHIRLGEEFVENGNLTNVSTFTCVDKTWINYSLVSDVIIYLVYKVTGFAGIYFLSYIVLVTGIYLTYRLIKKLVGEKIDPVTIVVYLVTSISLLNVFSAVRPQLFSYLYVVILLYFLIQKKSERFTVKQWLFLLITSIIFINLHSAFVSGYLIILLFFLKNSVQRLFVYFDKPTRANLMSFFKQALHYFFVGTSLLLIAGINYWGFDVWGEIIRGVTTDQIGSISEWQNIDFNNLLYFIYFIMISVVVFLRKYLGQYQFILVYLIPFSLLSFFSIRNIFYNIPILIVAFFILIYGIRSEIKGDLLQIFSTKVFRRLMMIYFVILVALLLLLSVGKLKVDYNYVSNADSTDVKKSYPYDALEVIKNQFKDKRFFNNYGWGGYLTFKAPEIKWFIDGRMTAWQCDGNFIDKEIMSDYFAIDNIDSKWKRVIEHWKIDGVLTKPGSNLAVLLGELPEWQLAYKDSVAVVFIKN